MSAAAANTVLTLSAATNQLSSQMLRMGGEEESQFSQALSQQIQSRQLDQASSPANLTTPTPFSSVAPTPAPVSNMQSSAPVTAPAVSLNAPSPAPTATQDATSAGDSDGTEAASASDSATTVAGNQNKANAGSNGTTNTSSSSQPNKTGAKPGNDQQDDASQAAQDASAAAQLQAWLGQGMALNVPSTDSANVDGPGVSKGNSALDGIEAKVHTHSATEQQGDAHDAVDDDGKEASAKAVTDRQCLPVDAAAATERATTSFADLMDRRIQMVDSGAARQQTTAIGNVRNGAVGGSNGADPEASAYKIYEPVGSEGWDAALGNKMVMMVSNDKQEVAMQLNPPHLGPMEVKLSLDQNQMNVTFVAEHAPVREALEASMPKLNQMLAESGIQLGQTFVQSQSQQQSGNQSGQNSRQSSPASLRAIEAKTGSVNTSGWRQQLVGGLPGNVNLFV